MKAGVLLLWTACLLSIALSLLRLAWLATAQEQFLMLSLVLLAVGSFKRR